MKIRLKMRSRPHDPKCSCAKSKVYQFHWIPMRTLWGFNTREYTWLWWALLITGINKKKYE